MDSKTETEKLKKYFEEIIPDYSKEKVYVSDIKKIMLWYNLLHKKGMLIKEEPDKKDDSDKAEAKGEAEAEAEKTPATKKKKKKSVPGSKD
jgi:hypothetical protein